MWPKDLGISSKKKRGRPMTRQLCQFGRLRGIGKLLKGKKFWLRGPGFELTTFRLSVRRGTLRRAALIQSPELYQAAFRSWLPWFDLFLFSAAPDGPCRRFRSAALAGLPNRSTAYAQGSENRVAHTPRTHRSHRWCKARADTSGEETACVFAETTSRTTADACA